MLRACGVFECVRRCRGDDEEGEEGRGGGDARVTDETGGGGGASIGKCGGVATARRFGWAEVESVTGGFSSRVIGQGGFSTVYLASLTSSRLGAVKVQRSSERLHRAFRQELGVLLSLRHPHVVRLLGYCDDREEGVLVFEYAPNGDLHKKLHGGAGDDRAALPWARRMAIAFQVAMALEYLHESHDPAVIHGDIKASNVLLDSNLDAKLCDFGNAHVGFSAAIRPPPAATRASARPVMGSPGYVDPHFLRSGVATKKSDVYSFGVLLFELVTGREAICGDAGCRLTAAVVPTVSDGNVAGVVDRRLGDDYNGEEAATVATLALRCVSDSPGLRPSMAEVVRVLQEKTTALISAVGSKPDGKMVS